MRSLPPLAASKASALIGISATSSQASHAHWTRVTIALQGQNESLQAELAALQRDHNRQLTEAHEQLKAEKRRHSDSLKTAQDETQQLRSECVE